MRTLPELGEGEVIEVVMTEAFYTHHLKPLLERQDFLLAEMPSEQPDVDYQPIIDASYKIPTIGLQFSIHESTDEARGELMSKMLAKGYSVRMFDPAGQDDIGGGCGQLWFVQDWMRQHPELARPSIGNGLPVIHTPRPVGVTA